MKANVNSNCIGCGICESTCPAVFHMTDSGLAEAITQEIPLDQAESAREARDGCPVSAIEIE